MIIDAWQEYSQICFLWWADKIGDYIKDFKEYNEKILIMYVIEKSHGWLKWAML